MLDELMILDYNHLYIDYQKGRYTKVIFDGKAFMESYKDNIKYNILVSTLLIKSYLECNNTKQATILVSNLEDIVGENYLDESIDFLYAAKATYSRLSNFDAVYEFGNRITELEKIKNPIKKEIKEKKKEEIKIKNNEEIIIPIVELKKQITDTNQLDVKYNQNVLNPSKKIEEVKTQEIIKKITSTKTIELANEFKTIEGILNGINNLNPDLKFREVFRLSSIEFAKAYNIEEIYLFYENKNLFGIHYKKERAYDKKLTLDQIKNTINYASFIQNTELFYDDKEETYNISIINNKEYEENKYILSIPLKNEYSSIGSITFYSNNPFYTNGLCYEMIMIFTSLINTRLMIYLNQEKLKRDNNRTFFLINNMQSGIKEDHDGYIELNDNASNILGTVLNLRMEDFLYNMDISSLQEYKKLYEEIKYSLEIGKSIEYKYKKDDNEYVYIKETFYPEIIDGNLWITSLIEDITLNKNHENELRKLAYKNPISNLYTEIKMLDDLKLLIKDSKFSLIILEVDDFNMFNELYGYNLQYQIIKAIGIELSDILQMRFKYSLYHLERDRFAIITKDLIDKRKVESILNEILNDVRIRILKRNSRINLNFNCGIERVGKSYEKRDINIVYGNALDALVDAANIDSKKIHIAHFNSELNKKRFIESERINAVSEAIDTSKIALNYQQIVNLSDKSVFGFYVIPSHESYEIEYSLLESVARRKNLVKRFDKYVTDLVIKEFKMLESKIRFTMPIIFFVHSEVIDNSFVKFIYDRINFYKINSRYITLLVDDANNPNLINIKKIGLSIASKNPLDVYFDYVDFIFYDYHKSTIESAIDFSKITKDKKSIFIMDQINTDDDINLCINNNLNIIYGNKYKLLRKINELLEKIK